MVIVLYSLIKIVRGNGVSMERLPIDCSAAENAEGGKEMIIKPQNARAGEWRREKNIIKMISVVTYQV